MTSISKHRFEEIMNDEVIGGCKLMEKGCNALKGLLIIQKYIPDAGVSGADHDIIYSVSCDELIKEGITEDDVVELRKLNWMIHDDYMACFV